jgi:hypothetical protein
VNALVDTSFHLFQDHDVKEENILFVSLIAAETGGIYEMKVLYFSIADISLRCSKMTIFQ